MTTLTEPPVFALEIRDVDTSSPARARRWLAWVLETAGVARDTVDAVLLAASELVTNAALYVGGRVLVSAHVTDAGVRLAVHDDGAPWTGPARGVLAESGRGLAIVEALAEQCAVTTHPMTGTTVTALIPAPGIGAAA